ncbi:hypothetical protein [Streptomyces sp. NRRL WC-3742]|uniref:hypothetical protein n=1 Tax=Streptomyces sp. NRRL WC-3742 TaxID=1463934 RepID=UPI00131C41F8|nr:hypothetical protein [Streptomyces sp. NRRL WC-3742]
MQNGSVRNSGAADVLFDVAVGAVCERKGCEQIVPPPERGRRGRRSKYCSTACKSAAARDKAKDDGLEGAQAEVLRCAKAAVDAARAFLDTVDDDPMGAYDAFYTAHATLCARAREAAEDVRDEVRWPGLTGPQLELRRAEETVMRSNVLARVSPEVLAAYPPDGPAVSDRSENPAPAAPPVGPAVLDRSEKAPVPVGAAAPADTEERQAETFEALRRAACTIPTLRFGEPDRLDDLDLTVGEGWLLASWDNPQAEDVHQLLYRGRSIGWTAPLPDGPWGQAGHIAAKHRGSKAAVVLTDPASGASTHRTVGQALDFLHRTHIELLRPDRAMPGVQRLALKRPTGWIVPSARGLGDPDREALGDGLVHLTWPDHPGVQELQQGGRPVGWIEEYDVQRGTWTALIDSSLLADAASGEPLRCPGAEGALALLRRALGEHLTRW